MLGGGKRHKTRQERGGDVGKTQGWQKRQELVSSSCDQAKGLELISFSFYLFLFLPQFSVITTALIVLIECARYCSVNFVYNSNKSHKVLLYYDSADEESEHRGVRSHVLSYTGCSQQEARQESRLPDSRACAIPAVVSLHNMLLYFYKWETIDFFF